MQQDELARIRTSPGRRVLGVGAMTFLGGMLVYMGAGTPGMDMLWRAALAVGGALSLFVAQVMWRCTAHDLILTTDALTDSDGTVLARMDEIARVDRGTFAAKPSNGFLLILKSRAPRAWRPGLWWRLGRRVAIGGVTAGSQTRPVADMIKIRLTEMEGAE